jgi:hypothetical protein
MTDYAPLLAMGLMRREWITVEILIDRKMLDKPSDRTRVAPPQLIVSRFSPLFTGAAGSKQKIARMSGATGL